MTPTLSVAGSQLKAICVPLGVAVSVPGAVGGVVSPAPVDVITKLICKVAAGLSGASAVLEALRAHTRIV